jgi:hypothetical protein
LSEDVDFEASRLECEDEHLVKHATGLKTELQIRQGFINIPSRFGPLREFFLSAGVKKFRHFKTLSPNQSQAAADGLRHSC